MHAQTRGKCLIIGILQVFTKPQRISTWKGAGQKQHYLRTGINSLRFKEAILLFIPRNNPVSSGLDPYKELLIGFLLPFTVLES